PLDDLLDAVADLELPELPGELRPADPLDPKPLLEAATRAIGSALGLTLLVARQLAGATEPPPSARVAAPAAGLLGLLPSFPTLRNGLRTFLGRNTADVVFGAAGVVTLTIAGSSLGLTVLGVEGLILFRAVLAQRAAWKRYEDRIERTPVAQAGAVIRLEPG